MSTPYDGWMCGCVWRMKFVGSKMKRSRARRLWFQNFTYINGDENALLPLGQKGMGEKQEKDECRLKVISCLRWGELAWGVVLQYAWWLSAEAWPCRLLFQRERKMTGKRENERVFPNAVYKDVIHSKNCLRSHKLLNQWWNKSLWFNESVVK